MTRPGGLGTLALALAGAVGCHARTEEFYARIYDCESNVSDSCGTTASGKPMTCFAASQLGGQDFCAEACDPAQRSTDPHAVCVSSGTSGALLQVCAPGDDSGDPAFRCPSDLSCYRTDLLTDSGVCIKMPVCSKNTDCGEHRPVCASTLLAARAPSSLHLLVDHLQCLVSMCGGGTPCPPGEGCLAHFYDVSDSYDICVPTCDGSSRCPPNYTCAFSPASSGSPSLCLPGVPGIRCQSDQDCVVGDCVDTGAGFNECVLTVLACQTDLDCAILDGPSSTFLCVEGVPGAGKHCIMKEEFGGMNCADASDCAAGFICTEFSAYGPTMTHGECRLPCGADLSCPPRGGIPHVCLGGGAGGCYPTSFGLPCASGADCMPELSCLPVLPDEHTVIDSPTICTTACTTDADCLANPLIRGTVFCRQDEHLCRMAGYPGAPCEADDQCISKDGCNTDGGVTGTCAP